MSDSSFGAAPRLADHRTPFVFNEWYVAALSSEVGRELKARTLLSRSVLLYRRLDGSIAAIRNRCPHRSFPLAHGRLDGDEVICGYHGLKFASSGRCVEVPSQKNVPSAMRVQAYPVVEQAPFIWIWMGDPDRADPATIPDHHWLSDPDYAAFDGYLHCKSNYIRLHENVLDLTHFPYVHGDAVGGLDYIAAPTVIRAEGDAVSITRRLENQPVNLNYGRLIGNEGNRVNRTSESWFKSPAFHIAHATIEDLEGGVGGKTDFHVKIIHCFTPETPHSSHYFFANARDVRIDDAELTAVSRDRARSTFLEDDAALELVEDCWKYEDNSDFEELSILGDRAGLQMRLIVSRRAAAEDSARSDAARRAVAAQRDAEASLAANG
ncbi:MAG: (2Fe-2S)-binding protein [Sphingopyxis macrogoltabida]|uniref:(2Fe-2S)-binding protein n=1 Tax=Sphingopyxis macrogoltabida TaxID=33050 RepID=A0A2W5L022_SPHMC|nr:MAG: (2Fe-2S)-binding protein [Sphingopyxis macrogoltabida]